MQNEIHYPLSKNGTEICKPHTKCRVCGSEKLVSYLNLGQMPLSNNLAESTLEAMQVPKFPLELMVCTSCYLSQLSVVIDPEAMFGHYVYRSSINGGYVKHCRQMAIDLKEKLLLTSRSFMIDIAGNDGALLQQFKEEIGLRVLNIDPARNLAPICEAAGIAVQTDFWGTHAGRKILYAYGRADLITATNVFAHVDDVESFILAAGMVLTDKGFLVLEFPYLIDFIEKKEFDTVYFEHLSYFRIEPLLDLCHIMGLKVVDVEKQQIHGGTVRVTVGHDHNIASKSVKYYVDLEKNKGFTNLDKYLFWAGEVRNSIFNFKMRINNLISSGYTVAGFAASAKGNTLLNACDITVGSMKYIVDQTPEKIGKYSPGTGIPIVSMLDLERTPPDFLVILSWNFAKEIMDKCRKVGFRGKFIIPIPEFLIID